MNIKYQLLFILFCSCLVTSCKDSNEDAGVQPVIEWKNMVGNELKADPGSTFRIEATVSSEDELTGIFYFVQRKDKNNHVMETPYEFDFNKEDRQIDFFVDLYADENLIGVRMIAQGKNAKREEKVNIVVNSFVKYRMEKEKLITIPGTEVEVRGMIFPIGNVISAYYEMLSAENAIAGKGNFTINADGSFSFAVTPDEKVQQLRLVVENREGIGVTSLPVITYPYVEEGTFMNQYYNIKLTTALDGTPYFSPDVKPYALNMEQAKSNQKNLEFLFVNMVNVAPKWVGIGLCVFANNVVATTVAANEYVVGMTYPEGDANNRRFVYHSLMAEWPFTFVTFADDQASFTKITAPELDWTTNGILRFNDSRHGPTFGFKLQDGRKAIAEIVKVEGTGYDAVIYLNFKCMR